MHRLHKSNIKHLTLQHEATPLHLAAWAGEYEVCDVLLQAGADVHCRDNVGRHVKYQNNLFLVFNDRLELKHRSCQDTITFLFTLFVC